MRVEGGGGGKRIGSGDDRVHEEESVGCQARAAGGVPVAGGDVRAAGTMKVVVGGEQVAAEGSRRFHRVNTTVQAASAAWRHNGG